MKPVHLAPNTLASFYRGAGRIAGFRRDEAVDPTHAEDWIASTTTRWGTAETGRTRLADGSTLAAAFDNRPYDWLGPTYVEQYGAAGALLVKLLDAGNRLPLHVHPDRSFAAEHLACRFGKSEAWLVLAAEPGSSAHLGFSRDLTASELDRLVADQDTTTLFEATNQIPLSAGDVVFCPGGIPHSIGAGALILEIQEMTDFSIMLEWADFPIDPDAVYLGLDRGTALGAVRHEALSSTEVEALRGQCIVPLASGEPGVTQLLPASAGGLFAAEQVIAESPRDGLSLDARFSVLVVNEGSGELRGEWGAMPIAHGDVLAVPYAAGVTEVAGAASAIRCYPSTSKLGSARS